MCLANLGSMGHNNWALAVGEPVGSGHQQYRQTDIARGLRSGGGSDAHNYHFDRDITQVCSNCAQNVPGQNQGSPFFPGIPGKNEPSHGGGGGI